jgi:hypothetical protein
MGGKKGIWMGGKKWGEERCMDGGGKMACCVLGGRKKREERKTKQNKRKSWLAAHGWLGDKEKREREKKKKKGCCFVPRGGQNPPDPTNPIRPASNRPDPDGFYVFFRGFGLNYLLTVRVGSGR